MLSFPAVIIAPIPVDTPRGIDRRWRMFEAFPIKPWSMVA